MDQVADAQLRIRDEISNDLRIALAKSREAGEVMRRAINLALALDRGGAIHLDPKAREQLALAIAAHDASLPVEVE